MGTAVGRADLLAEVGVRSAPLVGWRLRRITEAREECARRWRGFGPLFPIPPWAQRYLPAPAPRKQIDLPFGGNE